MTVGVVHHFPGGTKAQYDAVVQKVVPDGGMPPGELHHAAGETDQGWMVTTVWESKEKFEAFFANTLGPALAELGDKAFPNPPHMSMFEVHREKHS